MSFKIDPQLAFLQEAAAEEGEHMNQLAESRAFGIEARGPERRGAKRAGASAREVQILVQSSGDAAELAAAGMNVRAQAGDVFSGVVPIDRVAAIAQLENVERIESAREMVPELDIAIAETRVNLVHTGPPGRRGSGVIVGIVDSGIDFTHPSFRRPDGSSRILYIWDQNLIPQGAETSPSGFGVGVEYTKTHIDAALVAANPFATVRHRDLGAHGTHVAGIAAGDGSEPGQMLPAFTFVGVAPEADLIVVSVGGSGSEGLGTSSRALEALSYCYQKAEALGRPCAVNMSLGDNLGPHDGTSLLERGLDNLLGSAGRGFVKSAGNVGDARHHAGGSIATGSSVDVSFAQPATNVVPDLLDFWYRGADTLRATIFDAAGNSTGAVDVGTSLSFNLPSGNRVRIDHRDHDLFNGDRRIFITIERGTAAQILPGTWRLRLRSTASPAGGRFDGWIQRNNNFNERPTFLAPFESNDRTISTPGTARKVITAANYITRGAGTGNIASSSSRGPTRDGRSAPTIGAPGQSILSARADHDEVLPKKDPYVGLGGTSMSAPHITGILALMLQKNSKLTQEQMRECLEKTARSDAFTGPVPNTAFGAGKVDAKAALDCVPLPLVVVPYTRLSPCLRPTVIQPLCQFVTRLNCPDQSRVRPCISVTVDPCIIRSRICPVTQVTPCITQIQVCKTQIQSCPTRIEPLCGGGGFTRVNQLCGGPSIIDGCPSTPGGCDPHTVVINPTVIDSATLIGRPGAPGLGPIARGAEGYEVGDEGQASANATPPPIDWSAYLPAEGYFEYDERWFEDPS